ncbi:MAG: class I SAM-dependent methyltransferase [Polyangiaceae bacterium]|nr:class I SAM-dependent methyltransferase [Polyangiaceae bacterium]
MGSIRPQRCSPRLASGPPRSASTSRLLEGVAERLPFPDESFDTLVITYTFCSVDDPAVVAQELARVVRRGGKLLFAEHGVAQTESSRALQRSLEPTWKKVAGGCTSSATSSAA